MGNIYSNPVGLVIDLDTVSDISGGSDLRIYFLSPGGTRGYWVATADGTHGLTYTLLEDDMLEIGIWQLQAYVDGLMGDVAQIEIIDSVRELET